MTDARAPVLTDPTQRPTDAAIRDILGPAAGLWEALFERIHRSHPGLEDQWRYYVDGHRWLLKVLHGSRTVAWVSVAEGAFRLTVYLPGRAEQVVAASSLPDDLKAQYIAAAPGARTRPITVTFADEADLDAAEQLITLRDGFR